MAITFHSNWAYGSYENDRVNFITQGEALRTQAYFDGSSIAIGLGYDLIQNNNAQIQSDLNLTLTATQAALLIEARATTTTNARRKEIADALGLTISEAAVKSTFTNVIAPRYEDRLDSRLAVTVPFSNERIALFSLIWSGHLQDYPTVPEAPEILTEVNKALVAGDRSYASGQLILSGS